jgi:hypothetical protein
VGKFTGRHQHAESLFYNKLYAIIFQWPCYRFYTLILNLSQKYVVIKMWLMSYMGQVFVMYTLHIEIVLVKFPGRFFFISNY